MEHIRLGHMMDFTWQMSWASGNFDLERFMKSAENRKLQELQQEYRKYMDDPMNDEIVRYWADVGVKKDFYPCDLETARSRRDAHHFSVLHPMEWEKGRKYPVVYFCHAGGQDAHEAEIYGMAERMREEPFLYVCPNRYGPEEFVRIMGELEAQEYPIDPARIYVMGFSGGSGSAAEIALAYPEKIAGAALMPGPNAFNQISLSGVPEAYKTNPELRMPVICIGGTCDGGDLWPLVDDVSFENLNRWLEQVAKVPDYQATSRSMAEELLQNGDSVQKQFGLPFHKTYINEAAGEYVYVGDYLAGDGTAIARFCSVYGLPHGVFPVFLAIAWEYLKKFQRDPGSGALLYNVPNMDFRTRRPAAGGAK